MEGLRKLLAQRPGQTALTAGAIMMFAMLYFVLARPLAAGILYDDGVYMMSAMAMAAGKGYMLPWVEGTPPVFKYPPLFPALLSIPALWLQSIQAQVTAFLVLNLIFSLAALTLIFQLFRQHYGFSPALAAGLLVMVATSWRFLEPATAVMTEPLYLLLTTGLFIVYLKEQNSDNAGVIHWPVVLLGLLAFYTRTMGILALGAMALHLLWNGKIKSAAVYGACFAVGIFPWFYWGDRQPNQPLQIGDFLIRTFQENYGHTLQMVLQYEHQPLSLYGEGFSELVSGLSLLVFPWLETLQESPVSETATLIISLALSAILLIGLARCLIRRDFSLVGIYTALYLLVLPVWSFHDQYPRFLAMILPFLLPQFIMAAQTHLSSVKLRQGIIAGFLSLGIATNLLHLWGQTRQDTPILADYHAVFGYIREHTKPGDVIWTDNTMDSMYLGLWTHRPALDFFVFYPGRLSPRSTPEELKPLFRKKADVLYRMLSMNRVRYVVINHALLTRNQIRAGRLVDRDDPASRFLMQDHAGGFKKVATSPNGFMTVYRTRFVLPDPSIPK